MPLLAALLAIIVGAVPALAATVDTQIEDARSQEEMIRGELEAVTRAYEDTRAAADAVADELIGLETEERRLEHEAADIDARLSSRAREFFKHGSTGTLDSLLGAESATVGVERASLINTLQQRESADLEEAVAVRTALDQTRALAAESRRRLAQLEEELAVNVEALQHRLEDAELVVQSLEEMEARQRTIDRGDQQGVYACPLDPGVTHFIDSWGFPRSGGRRHQGTDIMGPMGANVYAFTSGVVARHSNSRLGGISLYLRGDDGSTYFYAHLQGFAPRGAVGTRVNAGEHIAYNGNTGNARGGAPHIHFERHPGGGAAVNPYPWLVAACF